MSTRDAVVDTTRVGHWFTLDAWEVLMHDQRASAYSHHNIPVLRLPCTSLASIRQDHRLRNQIEVNSNILRNE